MPKPTPKPSKLHNKGRPISVQKAFNPETSENATEPDPENAMRQFELELCWCIQQLERSLTSKKGSEKQMQDSWKVLQVLKNNNQPMIRKRQMMRTHFGDYRAKMLAEEKKLVKMANKMKISEKPVQPKATFLRKSVFQTTGDGSFRFNFNVKPETTAESNLEETNNTQAGNTEVITENPEQFKAGDSSTGAGDSDTIKRPVTSDNSNTYKFLPSGSEFKFNFDVSTL